MRRALSQVLVPAASALLLGGCGVSGELDLRRASQGLCDDGTLALAINSTGPVPAGCTKIEGGKIGQAPQTVELQGGTVTITGWVPKADGSGDEVGFTFTSTIPVKFAVKASTRTFVSTGQSWVHPDGTTGPSANGISNITFCPDDGFDDGTGGGDPDGGGGTTEECPPEDGGAGGGGGGGGGADAGVPCVQDSDCGPASICVFNVCQTQIG